MTLTGERISLKKLTVEDVTEKHINWLNDPEINQYLECRFRTHTFISVRQFIRDIQVDKNVYMFGIFLQNEHIGNIKLHIDPNHNTGDIGFLIGEKHHWGKGYMTEAIKLVADYGFKELELYKIHAGVYECNEGSRKALLKAGFRFEGRQSLHWKLNPGEHVDNINYAIWRDE